MEKIWEDVRLPQDWNSGLICPLYKKGDPNNCNNYRGIALLNVTYKVLAYCILQIESNLARNDYWGTTNIALDRIGRP